MDTCGKCRWYTMRRLEPICTKTGKATGFLQEKSCFEPMFEQPKKQSEMNEEKKPQMKVCKECGRELPVEMFGKHPKAKDGYQPLCKECRSRKMKAAAKKPEIPAEAVEKLQELEATVAKALEPSPEIRKSTDADLFRELSRRGWTGDLVRIEKRTLKIEEA
jgi:hypothetical protein